MPGPVIHDHLAELHVAGQFADAGWDVYFPRRDRGFDFIAGKRTASRGYITRPVQVKGKYPTAATRDRKIHGIKVELTETHPDMVLAIPFFQGGSAIIMCVAYAKSSDLRCSPSKSHVFHRCFPCKLQQGKPSPRSEFEELFGISGLRRLEDP